MAESKDLVRVVYYVFNPEYLFLNFSDLNRYKVDECIQEYTRLCQEELLNSYPQAEVVVNEGSTIEIYVEALDDKFEQTPDPSEQNVIEVICNRIYDSHNWVKIRDYIPVIEVKNRTKIPLPVIRWGCKQKLIEGVNNSTGRWDIVLSDIPEMEELIFIIDGHIPIQLPSTQIAAITCYLEDYNNISVMDIPENTSLLVASIEGFDEKLFTADNALWEIYRKGNQIDLEIEHFNDIVTWTGWKWSYKDWTKALKEQAVRKGINCEIQVVERNDKSEADGISFYMSMNVTRDMTISNVIDRSLLKLAEVVNHADLSLRGGPIWDDEADKIYQKNERRFREEILHPLLRKMKYNFVYHTHGQDEAGRDFVFAETTKFHGILYYAIQAKKGNISGGSNSEIDKVLGQIDDAFTMPFTKIPEIPNIHIGVVIVATSGYFKNEADKKIQAKLNRYAPKGSVYFWNKEKILALIAEQWRKENT